MTLHPALTPTTPFYTKSYLDLLLLAYIILVSLLRLLFNMFFLVLAHRWGITRTRKLRFGEQGYGGVFRRHGYVEDYPHPMKC
jgi:hypothetical protein